MKALSLALCAIALVGCQQAATDKSPTPISTLVSPAGADSAEPHLARTANGDVIMSWQEKAGDATALRFAVLQDDTWQQAATITTGNNWFVNWADFPSLTPLDKDHWAAHWLVKREGGTYSYDIAIAQSHDGGVNWGEPITPHTDGTATEHGFATLFAAPQGLGAIWLDGRNMSGDAHGGDSAGGMTLRSAFIDAEGQLIEEHQIDELVCDCCQTDVAVAADGPLVVYRNRTSEEIRDIYVSRYADGQWQAPHMVAADGWEIPGCPVNGPATVAIDNTVAVAWFTGAHGEAKVKLAYSSDGGKSFAEPIEIQSQSPLGRVDVEMLDNGDALVSWLQTDKATGSAQIMLQRVPAAAAAGTQLVMASTSAGRISGFAQIIRQSPDTLILAYTATEGGKQIATLKINTQSL